LKPIENTRQRENNYDGEKYISPDSKAFKDETDITKKGRLEISNSRSVDWAGNINGAFNKLTENNSLISMIIGARTEVRTPL
jgi:hypothetical protein